MVAELVNASNVYLGCPFKFSFLFWFPLLHHQLIADCIFTSNEDQLSSLITAKNPPYTIIIIFISIMSVSICLYIISIMISYVWRRKKYSVEGWCYTDAMYTLSSIILENLKSTPKVKWAYRQAPNILMLCHLAPCMQVTFEIFTRRNHTIPHNIQVAPCPPMKKKVVGRRPSGSEWMGIRAEYEAESIYCVLWQPIKVQRSLLFHAFPQNLITNMFMFSNIRSVQDLFHMRAKKLFDPKKVVTFGCFWCAHNRLWLQPGQSASSLFHNDQIQNSPPINIQNPCHGFSFLLKHLYFFGNQSDLSTLQECKINF